MNARAAWLAEMWPTCPEVPRWQRELDRAARVEREMVTDSEKAAARARRAALATLFGDAVDKKEAS